MSQRETNIDVSLQQWRGVNQRLQPTLVPDGFFSDARGMYFGFGENAERLPGKVLAGRLVSPVLFLFILQDKVLIQTLDALLMTDVSELMALSLTYQPGVPGAPVLSAVGFFTITATTPAVFPAYTTSFTLQRSLDNVSFATLQTGMAISTAFVDNTVIDATLYYYRVLAVNASNSTAGPSANATTPARLPDAPAAPTYANVVIDGFDVILPAMPAFGITLNLQSSPDNATWTTTNTGLAGGATINFTGLPPSTLFYFRAVGVNTQGTTAGVSSNVTTGAPTGNFRLTELSDTRITELGDNRVIE